MTTLQNIKSISKSSATPNITFQDYVDNHYVDPITGQKGNSNSNNEAENSSLGKRYLTSFATTHNNNEKTSQKHCISRFTEYVDEIVVDQERKGGRSFYYTDDGVVSRDEQADKLRQAEHEDQGNRCHNVKAKRIHTEEQQSKTKKWGKAEAYIKKRHLENNIDTLTDKEIKELERLRLNLMNHSSYIKCGDITIDNKKPTIMRHNNKKTGEIKSFWANVYRCNCFYCVSCAQKKQEEVKRKFERLQKAAEEKGYDTAFVTFTIPHYKRQSLEQLLEFTKQANYKFYNSRGYKKMAEKFGFAGWGKVPETTYSDKNGWHPHQHALITIKKCSEEERAELIKTLKDLWFTACEKVGLFHTLKMSTQRKNKILEVNVVVKFNCNVANYLSKGGESKAEYRNKSKTFNVDTIGLELAYNSTKVGRADGSYSISELIDNDMDKLWLEWMNAFRSRKQYFFDKIANEWIDEQKAKEEPAEEPEDIEEDAENLEAVKEFEKEEHKILVKVPGSRPHIQYLAEVFKDLKDAREAIDRYFNIIVLEKYYQLTGIDKRTYYIDEWEKEKAAIDPMDYPACFDED